MDHRYPYARSILNSTHSPDTKKEETTCCRHGGTKERYGAEITTSPYAGDLPEVHPDDVEMTIWTMEAFWPKTMVVGTFVTRTLDVVPEERRNWPSDVGRKARALEAWGALGCYTSKTNEINMEMG